MQIVGCFEDTDELVEVFAEDVVRPIGDVTFVRPENYELADFVVTSRSKVAMTWLKRFQLAILAIDDPLNAPPALIHSPRWRGGTVAIPSDPAKMSLSHRAINEFLITQWTEKLKVAREQRLSAWREPPVESHPELLDFRILVADPAPQNRLAAKAQLSGSRSVEPVLQDSYLVAERWMEAAYSSSEPFDVLLTALTFPSETERVSWRGRTLGLGEDLPAGMHLAERAGSLGVRHVLVLADNEREGLLAFGENQLFGEMIFWGNSQIVFSHTPAETSKKPWVQHLLTGMKAAPKLGSLLTPEFLAEWLRPTRGGGVQH